MSNGKDAGAGNASKDAHTPFERLTDFARRIIAVPKSELDKRTRAYERKRKRKPPRIREAPLL